MDVGAEETEAIARANMLVANMLQRPDQLQKVDQYKRRVQRKKASVEAMLKTAMQSQLDGVKGGLNQLQTALGDLIYIKEGLQEIEESIVSVPELSKQLNECRDEYVRHSQYATAMENLKHIFTVPESVEKTNVWISEGRLLYAHQCLMDLENSRDDLLYELHKLPHQNPNDTGMLKEYFAEVQTLSDNLGKQVWIILQRTLNTVRKEPAQIVTALRIIEWEEKTDEFALIRHKSSGFLPPGRPKKWRAEAFRILEESVQQRIEGNQFEDREDNKLWLIRHLEIIRLLVLEDMKVVKTLCLPCFPPDYDIYNRYVKMYHNALSNHLKEIIDNGLEGNEFVTMLGWVLNTYPSKELMAHPTLNINMTQFRSLLGDEYIELLEKTYRTNVDKNYDSWMTNALELEKKEWWGTEAPQQSSEGQYKTDIAQHLYNMIKQNLDVAATLSSYIQVKILIASLISVKQFAGKFAMAITDYKEQYFLDRSKIHYYTIFMIALANSCQAVLENMSLIKSQYWRPGGSTRDDTKIATEFDALSTNYSNLRHMVCDYLLIEPQQDLKKEFDALLTQEWLHSDTGESHIDTICLTLKDYFDDYTSLHQRNFDRVVSSALNSVVVKYVTAVLEKRISLKNYDDRKHAANRIIQEAEKLQSVFDDVVVHVTKFDSPCEVLKVVAEVIKVEDLDFVGLELNRLLRRYPDASPDHLIALLMLRGDLGRLDIRRKVAEVFEEVKNQRSSGHAPKSVFSEIHIVSSIF